MCLSKIYLREEGKDRLVVEEATRIAMDSDGTIEISSMFDENKNIHNYFIKEVDFIKSCTILCRKDDI
ncbi:MAG: CooT family nickel-binding protein [Methanosarcinales archaeon]|uniref:CooT family nickel-binding protein n=1 Tax=Candidatus Ethanoperedens thermophilum TaxID=2766897 RepID=A0A848D744_9EURY|nr:CooT family nickel-binding protein [Candidatus Ethanoperedens thermophilum]